MNVLIADDDAVTRLLIRSALEKLGHQVHETENGLAAWAAWELRRHPLVISDWMMPDMDGLELCRKIRSSGSPEFTYIILLTARAGKANYLDAMDSGVDDFINKPFEKDQFVARVRVATRILDLHKSVRVMNVDLERRVRERTAELEKALRVKSEFLSRASHELRTPMNHVLGFAQLLDMNSLTPGQKENVEHILKGGYRLLGLIDRILTFSQSSPEDLSFLDGKIEKAPAAPDQTLAEP